MKEDIFQILFKEFEDIGHPIINHTIHAKDNFHSYSFGNVRPLDVYDRRTYMIEFQIKCSDEDFNCFKPFAMQVKHIEEPFLSFEDMQCSQDEIYSMPLEFKRRLSHIITMSCYIEDVQVYNFIKVLREHTAPIRERIFSQQFDEDVEDCLTEYNKDNGHK